MSQFCEDKTQIAIYPDGIFAEERGALCIRCLQWGDDLQEEERNLTLPTAQALVDTAQGSKAALRVAFLPIIPKVDAKDLDTDETEDFRTLVKHFQIPSAVLAERMRSVGYSFGSKSYRDRSEIAWSHFLCRNVILSEDNVIEDLGYLDHGNDNGKMPSPNEMWTMCDFFLHTSPHATLETDGGRNVTLLCFGAPEQVVRRFHRLQNEDAWHDVRDQPYLLFDIIYDELHQLFDSAVAKLRQAVKPQEKAALERAGSHASSQEAGLDLQSLHNIQKNCIFMIEAAEASIATLQAMSEKIRRSRKDSLSLEVADAIEYRRRSFHSTLLRSHSLEKRMTNVIQLSFNLITQADSTILKFDSKAMRLSASMTFAFLPLTGVATLFSTPFFDINWDGPESPEREGRVFRVSTTFWIFWCVAFPLTLFVVVSGAFAINHTKDFGERIASSFVDIVKYGRVRRKSRALEKDDVGNGNV